MFCMFFIQDMFQGVRQTVIGMQKGKGRTNEEETRGKKMKKERKQKEGNDDAYCLHFPAAEQMYYLQEKTKKTGHHGEFCRDTLPLISTCSPVPPPVRFVILLSCIVPIGGWRRLPFFFPIRYRHIPHHPVRAILNVLHVADIRNTYVSSLDVWTPVCPEPPGVFVIPRDSTHMTLVPLGRRSSLVPSCFAIHHDLCWRRVSHPVSIHCILPVHTHICVLPFRYLVRFRRTESKENCCPLPHTLQIRYAAQRQQNRFVYHRIGVIF